MRKFFSDCKQWYKNNPKTVLSVAGIILLDHLTKIWAMYALEYRPIELFPFLHFRYVENTGAAFGMMQGGNFILIFVMLAIIAYILHSWKELCSHGSLVEWGAIFILSGALGNLYDRITLGFVVDFIDFRVWPVFNIADSFITIGGCMFFISLFLKPKKNREEK